MLRGYRVDPFASLVEPCVDPGTRTHTHNLLHVCVLSPTPCSCHAVVVRAGRGCSGSQGSGTGCARVHCGIELRLLRAPQPTVAVSQTLPLFLLTLCLASWPYLPSSRSLSSDAYLDLTSFSVDITFIFQYLFPPSVSVTLPLALVLDRNRGRPSHIPPAPPSGRFRYSTFKRWCCCSLLREGGDSGGRFAFAAPTRPPTRSSSSSNNNNNSSSSSSTRRRRSRRFRRWLRAHQAAAAAAKNDHRRPSTRARQVGMDKAVAWAPIVRRPKCRLSTEAFWIGAC